MKLQLVPCPLCGQSEVFKEIAVTGSDLHIHKYGDLYAGKKVSEWKVCGRCGFVHQNPRPTVEALNEFYMQSSYHPVEDSITPEQRLSFSRWYYSEKIDFALSRSGLSHGSVFDIGCGDGGVLKLFEMRGWQTCGVEPDQGLAKFAIDEFGLNNVKHGILDRRFKLEDKVDLIFSNHAFEHFADLNDVMDGVCNILKPGGYLFIAIPTYLHNRSSLSKRWMNSAHYSLFTHNSLSNLLSRYGFKEVVHTYSGWQKEVDDLWYLAKFTGEGEMPEKYYENPEMVSRYLKRINPFRSFIFYPVYSPIAIRIRNWLANLPCRFINGLKLLFESPSTFLQKLQKKLGA